MVDDNKRKRAEQALKKKALGYQVTEVVEEYGVTDEGGMCLTKRKVTKKDVPPDLAALKAYLDFTGEKGEYENYTLEELLEEKRKLLMVLAESESEGEEK